jgi:hypothetical protein
MLSVAAVQDGSEGGNGGIHTTQSHCFELRKWNTAAHRTQYSAQRGSSCLEYFSIKDMDLHRNCRCV